MWFRLGSRITNPQKLELSWDTIVNSAWERASVDVTVYNGLPFFVVSHTERGQEQEAIKKLDPQTTTTIQAPLGRALTFYDQFSRFEFKTEN